MAVGVGGHSLFAVANRIYLLERQMQAGDLSQSYPLFEDGESLVGVRGVGILSADLPGGQGRFTVIYAR
jgi:hypothetical protein